MFSEAGGFRCRVSGKDGSNYLKTRVPNLCLWGLVARLGGVRTAKLSFQYLEIRLYDDIVAHFVPARFST
jgi:hypothetical protein